MSINDRLTIAAARNEAIAEAIKALNEFINRNNAE